MVVVELVVIGRFVVDVEAVVQRNGKVKGLDGGSVVNVKT